MPKKIDPLNKKNYGAVTASLVVADVAAAAKFYKQAFGFELRGIMKGPDRKPIHGELTLRGTTIMLSPENPQRNQRSPKTMGGSPVGFYVLTEHVDKMVAKAIKLGATAQSPVMEMFWGDRSGSVVDPDGYSWMIGTHMSEPTPAEMAKKMKEMMAQPATA